MLKRKLNNNLNPVINGNTATYNLSATGIDVLSPVIGTVTKVESDSITIKVDVDDCKFSVEISGIKPNTNIYHGKYVSTNSTIGENTKDEVIVKVTSNTLNRLDIKDYWEDGKACKKEDTSSKEEKKGKSSSSADAASMGIMSPYEVAALPFLGIEKGAKAITGGMLRLGKNENKEELKNLVEEIERIKELLK